MSFCDPSYYIFLNNGVVPIVGHCIETWQSQPEVEEEMLKEEMGDSHACAEEEDLRKLFRQNSLNPAAGRRGMCEWR